MKTIPLRYLAQINPPAPEFDSQPEDAEVEFLPLEAVWADARADQTRRILKSASGGYTRYNSGDIVSPKVTPTFQAARSMIAQSAGVGTTELHVLRAREGVDPRWICYALRSSDYLREGVTAFQGVAGLQRVPADFVAAFRVAHRTADEQRRIADFLDDRVARIDQIIAARQQQATLSAEAAASAASTLLRNAPSGPPLSALAAIIDTEHKTAPSTPGGGFWVAGTNAIRHGELVPDELREIDAEAYREWTMRGTPVPGDVLLTREAPVGHVALLRAGNTKVAIGQRVVLLKPRADALDSGFLRLVLMHGALRPVIDQASAGSLHPHLNMADISRLRIPNVDMRLQSSLAAEHSRLLEVSQSHAGGFAKQIDLLQEYKQSLITAAVTGEFDVTTASTRIPE